MKSKKGHSKWIVQVISKEMAYEEVVSFQNMEEAREWANGEEVESMKELMPDLYVLSMSEKLYLQKWNSEQEIWWMNVKRDYGF